MILRIYRYGMRAGEPLLRKALLKRQKNGKESLTRLDERCGVPGLNRPSGPLIWVHAASVGEAQSALILIQTLLTSCKGTHILVTTGTLTSASMMEKNLPKGAFHQFYPLDHPKWAQSFLDHWQPDFVLWMESELWPNMILGLGQRKIPAVLVNARMSEKSHKRWALFKNAAEQILQSFSQILCQTDGDATLYKKLGGQNVTVTDNIKYNAKPLAADEDDLKALNAAMGNRPRWVYASTHASEELVAARIHAQLKTSIPELITIVVPRHPNRRDDIVQDLKDQHLNVVFRSKNKTLPKDNTDIYVADTMGELGLFYRSSPIAVIGRSLSDDGGGGHNPIEAAQLNCAVLHGPNVRNLKEIFDQMNAADAAFRATDETALADRLHELLIDEALCNKAEQSAFEFAKKKEKVLEGVLNILQPYLESLEMDRKAS